MKKILLPIFFLFFSLNAHSYGLNLNKDLKSAVGLSVPSYSDHTTIENMANAGDIVYDTTTQSFYGRTSSSVTKWTTLSSPVATERTERLAFNGGTTATNCITSPCNIERMSNSWVSSVTRNTTGSYTVNFTTNFSAPPSCTCNAAEQGVTYRLCSIDQANVTSSDATITITDGTIAQFDATVDLICVGPN